jgi:phycocyanin-associated, rod
LRAKSARNTITLQIYIENFFMIPPTSTSDTRFFVYEVAGLNRYQQPDNSNYVIRPSDHVFMQVPYDRMNEKMRSISRLGGTIVSIRPLNEHLSEGE